MSLFQKSPGPKVAGIPYHMAPGKLFDQKRAETFDVPNRLIIPAGEEITLE